VPRVALLDVNVLVALFDPDHVHHDLAHDWFADQRAAGWATCPVTENGLVRVLSHPRYANPPHRAADVVRYLRRFRDSGVHRFWADELSCCDTARFDLGHATSAQLTDVYLLGMAVRHRGCLATFDRGIPWKAVKGGRAALAVIAPAVG
jgi:uncharacterized protein